MKITLVPNEGLPDVTVPPLVITDCNVSVSAERYPVRSAGANVNTPVPLLYASDPPPDAAPVEVERSVNAIPLPAADVRSVHGAHSDPVHFNTCPGEGALEETFDKPPRASAGTDVR